MRLPRATEEVGTCPGERERERETVVRESIRKSRNGANEEGSAPHPGEAAVGATPHLGWALAPRAELSVALEYSSQDDARALVESRQGSIASRRPDLLFLRRVDARTARALKPAVDEALELDCTVPWREPRKRRSRIRSTARASSQPVLFVPVLARSLPAVPRYDSTTDQNCLKDTTELCSGRRRGWTSESVGKSRADAARAPSSSGLFPPPRLSSPSGGLVSRIQACSRTCPRRWRPSQVRGCRGARGRTVEEVNRLTNKLRQRNTSNAWNGGLGPCSTRWGSRIVHDAVLSCLRHPLLARNQTFLVRVPLDFLLMQSCSFC